LTIARTDAVLCFCDSFAENQRDRVGLNDLAARLCLLRGRAALIRFLHLLKVEREYTARRKTETPDPFSSPMFSDYFSGSAESGFPTGLSRRLPLL
jgi:hypothetical protein